MRWNVANSAINKDEIDSVKMFAKALIFVLLFIGVCAAVDQLLFTGKYSDPNHPGCARSVIRTSGSDGQVYGADAAGGEGVACDGSTDVKWGPLSAAIDGLKLVVDFSPKGGPSNLNGTYSVERNAIVWQDGNAWTKIN